MLGAPTLLLRGVVFNKVSIENARGFPGSPVVKTLPSSAGAMVSIPGQGARIPRTLGPKNQTMKQKQCCDEFNKDLKNGPR